MKKKLQRLTLSSLLLGLIILSTMTGCEKGALTLSNDRIDYNLSNLLLNQTDTSVFFNINLKGTTYTSFGDSTKSQLFKNTPCLDDRLRIDSTGQIFTDIEIQVRHAFLFNVLGDVSGYFRLTKKGAGVTGLYTTQVRSIDTIQAISISSLNGGHPFLIDSAGLEVNITREDISIRTGPIVDGNFRLILHPTYGPTDTIHSTGNFRLIRY